MRAIREVGDGAVDGDNPEPESNTIPWTPNIETYVGDGAVDEDVPEADEHQHRPQPAFDQQFEYSMCGFHGRFLCEGVGSRI